MKRALSILTLVCTCLVYLAGCSAKHDTKTEAIEYNLENLLQTARESRFENGPIVESTVEHSIEVLVENRVMVYVLEYGFSEEFDLGAFIGELYQSGKVPLEFSCSGKADFYRIAGESSLEYLIGKGDDNKWSIWRYNCPLILDETTELYADYTSQWPGIDLSPITDYEAEKMVKGE